MPYFNTISVIGHAAWWSDTTLDAQVTLFAESAGEVAWLLVRELVFTARTNVQPVDGTIVVCVGRW